jgi:hypothetical protein
MKNGKKDTLNEKWQYGIYWTFTFQIELLPRIAIMYGGDPFGISIEWLWLSIYVVKNSKHNQK